jgi:hypothetical protein
MTLTMIMNDREWPQILTGYNRVRIAECDESIEFGFDKDYYYMYCLIAHFWELLRINIRARIYMYISATVPNVFPHALFFICYDMTNPDTLYPLYIVMSWRQ